MEDPLPIKLGIKNFKTLHENKQDLNQFFEDKVINVIKQFPNTYDFKLPVSGVIADLDLSVRALNSLKQGGIVTTEDLFSLPLSDMTTLNFSSRTINEISEYQNKQDLEQFYDITLKPCKKECVFEARCKNKYSIHFLEKSEDNKKEQLESLPRFTPLSNSKMLEDIEGEYVLFSSVLNLFLAKNKNK